MFGLMTTKEANKCIRNIGERFSNEWYARKMAEARAEYWQKSAFDLADRYRDMDSYANLERKEKNYIKRSLPSNHSPSTNYKEGEEQ